MALHVRELTPGEADIVVRYFHDATPEHLETMGVDPTRLPPPDLWRERIRQQYHLPVEQRVALVVLWVRDDQPVGFSSCDKIIFGERANMHLHVLQPDDRRRGVGAECVRQSADHYFATLKLKTLFCEPNAFNVGPNRTLQAAGFKYVKTHMTVPGPLNYHQAVTRWVMERG
jgi:RimJ/RimL family protein N-acetyltransferase